MMGSVNDIREANRASPLFTHLTTVSEGITVLGWITIEPKPADYVNEVLDSAKFYGNRIIKEYKEKLVVLISGLSCFSSNVWTGIENTSNGSMLSTISSNL